MKFRTLQLVLACDAYLIENRVWSGVYNSSMLRYLDWQDKLEFVKHKTYENLKRWKHLTLHFHYTRLTAFQRRAW